MAETGDGEDDRRGVRSVEHGLRVLAALAGLPGPVTLSQIAAASGMAPATAHRHLVSLSRAGMVRQSGATGRYDLGPAALELGLAAIGRLDREGMGAEAIAALRDAIGETVLLAVWANRGPTVIDMAPSGRAVTVNVQIGSVLSPARSASGLAFMAFLPESISGSALAEEGGGRADLDRTLRQVRMEGIAVVHGTQLAGVSAVAAPVRDHRGRVIFAITVLGPSAGFDRAIDERIAPALKAAASRLSARFGHAPDPRAAS